MIGLKTNNPKLKTDERGVALYIAVTVTSALVLVSFAIISLALKQLAISSASRDSEAAFYAADSGAECAIFWDIKNPTNPGRSAFATSTGQQISCNTQTAVVGGGGSSATSTFQILFPPEPYCVDVTVVKGYSGGNPTTKIESRGYNTCDTSARQRVERAIRITY